MRISIVTSFFLPVPPVLGGSTEKIWFRLGRELARRGHTVTMVSRTWPGFAAEETVGGLAHRRLRGADHSRRLAVNLLRDFIWGLRVARALPSGDAVICNTVTLPAWLGRFKPAAGKVVAVVARMPKGRGRAYRRVERIFALGPEVARRLEEERPALAPRIRIVPYPIDWAVQAAARAPRAGPLKIGFVGRLHPEKGVGLLLAAAGRLMARADLPEWTLELIGPIAVAAGGGGEAWFEKEIRPRAGALGPRLRVRAAEFDPAKLALAYGGMDIFCYPSLAVHGETFGLAVAEAMAAGCAPVVSALSCFEPLVLPGETGLVFDQAQPGAEDRLAAALAELLGDDARRLALARRAQDHVRRFDFQVVADTVEKELESMAVLRE